MILLSDEHDAHRVLTFLVDNAYPYGWSEAALAASTKLRISYGDRTVGYVWVRWLTLTVLDFHICVTREFQGRWLSRTVLKWLYDYGRQTGAKAAIASVDRPSIESIYRRLGARIVGPLAIISFEDNSNGSAFLERRIKHQHSASVPAALSGPREGRGRPGSPGSEQAG